jgi:AcrR family transcriptional regulator
MPRTRVNASVRQEEILHATVALIYEKGLRAIRISDVATAMGVSPGLIIYHFRTKEELLARAFRFASMTDLTRAANIAQAQRDPLKRIISILKWYTPSKQSRSWLLWIDGWSAGLWNPEIAEALDEVHANWKILLHEAITEATAKGLTTRYGAAQSTTRLIIFADGLSIAELTGPTSFTKAQGNNWIEEFVRAEFLKN